MNRVSLEKELDGLALGPHEVVVHGVVDVRRLRAERQASDVDGFPENQRIKKLLHVSRKIWKKLNEMSQFFLYVTVKQYRITDCQSSNKNGTWLL